MASDLLQSEHLRLAMNAHAASNWKALSQTIKSYASNSGVSMQTAYKFFGSHGLVRPRKQRSDKGVGIVTRRDADRVLAFILNAERKHKGKIGLPKKTAIQELIKDGVITKASYASYERAFDKFSIDPKHRVEDRPYITLRSERPCDVFQVDASQAAQWYLRGGKFERDDATGLESYKPEKYKDGQLKRYIVVDHYTNAKWVMYQKAKGERAIDFIRILWESMSYKGDEYPMSGIPRLIYSDAGSGLTAKLSKKVFESLGTKYIHHEPGAPRAKGLVEGSHRWWEAIFENVLLARDITIFTLDELNEMAYRKCVEWNSNKILKRLNYGRGATSFDLWRLYYQKHPEELAAFEYPPSWERIEAIALGNTISRKVKGNYEIQYTPKGNKSPLFFNLKRLCEYRECQPGIPVSFRLSMVTGEENCIVMTTLDGKHHVIEPVNIGMDGRPVDAPVIGKEFKSNPDSLATSARKQALNTELPAITSGRGKIIPINNDAKISEKVIDNNRMLARPSWIEVYGRTHDVELSVAAGAYRACTGSDDVAEAREADVGVLWHEDNNKTKESLNDKN